MSYGLDGLFLGAGIALAGWFLSRGRLEVRLSGVGMGKVAEALRYAAKSARGGVKPKPEPAPLPDPRDAPMTAWLSRHGEIAGAEAENLLATWRYAIGAVDGATEAEKDEAIATLKAYGGPMPTERIR